MTCVSSTTPVSPPSTTAEYGEPMKVIATGGLANVFKDEIGLFDAIEPDLMSLGLLEVWRRNRK